MMDYSSPSSSSSNPLSPTSTAPSSAFPPTPTSRTRSTTFVNIARRNSGKRLSDALYTAKMAVVGGTTGRFSSYPTTKRASGVPVPVESYSYDEPVTVPKISSFGPLSRLRGHLKSTAHRKAVEPPASQPDPSQHSRTPQRPQKNESRGLQYVMPGLYLAFEDDTLAFGGSASSPAQRGEELRTNNGESFTHIIRLSTLKDPSQPPSIRYNEDSQKTQQLSLAVVPHSHQSYEIRMRILSSDPNCEGLSPESAQELYDQYGDLGEPYEGVTLLTSKQLLATRNFLYATRYDLQERHGRARILITAPRDHCTDASSVLVCYLAYASGNTAEALVQEINKHDTFLGAWKHNISPEGAAVIQDIINI